MSNHVAPHAGAGIEIWKRIHTAQARLAAPRVGAEIKIASIEFNTKNIVRCLSRRDEIE